MRPVYPMKLDFCRLTSAEMIRMFDQEIQKDLRDSSLFRPIVAIGHTKDFANSATVEAFLSYLKENDIPVVTFEEAYAKITRLDERS